jgi:hypothetical protein
MDVYTETELIFVEWTEARKNQKRDKEEVEGGLYSPDG